MVVKVIVKVSIHALEVVLLFPHTDLYGGGAAAQDLLLKGKEPKGINAARCNTRLTYSMAYQQGECEEGLQKCVFHLLEASERTKNKIYILTDLM